jgi:glycosyltransferase involved in cell wall biosynthesis
MSQQKIKIAFTISNISKVLLFEWLAEKFDKKYEPVFIIYNSKNTEIEEYLKKQNKIVYRINYKSKKDLPVSIYKTIRILKKEKIEIIHAHLFEATLISLTAAKLLGIRKRVYTRHHSSYHHDFFPNAVKYDKFINFIATDIIAISSKVKNILLEKENVPSGKVNIVYHGFDLDAFSSINNNAIEHLKTKYKLHDHFPVIGVVSRYTNWKGIEYIISAFERLLKKYPNAKIILANALGNDAKTIKEKLQNLDPDNYVEIEYERDMSALYKCMNIFVHVPIDSQAEAFGQVYIEAMAANIPCVVTLSGIANEYIKDGVNALVVDYKNADQIHDKIVRLLEDKDLETKITSNALKDVKAKFTLQRMFEELDKIYSV